MIMLLFIILFVYEKKINLVWINIENKILVLFVSREKSPYTPTQEDRRSLSGTAGRKCWLFY